MNYKVGIGGVLLVHIAFSYATILASTGNGSFVGLGAMLFALYCIPGTVIANFFIIRKHKNNPKRSDIVLLILISSIVPIVQLALLVAQKVLGL